jgi:hypothetical protein
MSDMALLTADTAHFNQASFEGIMCNYSNRKFRWETTRLSVEPVVLSEA